MTDNAKKFMEKVSNDEALQAELAAAVEGIETAGQTSVVIEFAKKIGFELTKEDFVSDDADIGLDELEAVTGGGQCICLWAGSGIGNGLSCHCSNSGGGGVLPNTTPGPYGGCDCSRSGVGKGGRSF